MIRRLPCKNCPDGATLTDGRGRKIPYEIGVTPSAFRTQGEPFRYDCLGCGKKGKAQTITKQAFFALLDMGLVRPTVESAAPTVNSDLEPGANANG